MDTAIELKDIIGAAFKVGDKVATDTTAYRSSALRVGVATEVRETRPGFVEVKVTYQASGKRSVWRRPEGVVKVAA